SQPPPPLPPPVPPQVMPQGLDPNDPDVRALFQPAAPATPPPPPRPPKPLNVIVSSLLRDYAIFHITATLLCTCWSMARVRAAAFPRTTSRLPEHSPANWLWPWPRLDSQPMLWKELLIEPGFRLRRSARLV